MWSQIEPHWFGQKKKFYMALEISNLNFEMINWQNTEQDNQYGIPSIWSTLRFFAFITIF